MAYASEHRPWTLNKPIVYQLLGLCQAVAQGRREFRFKNKPQPGYLGDRSLCQPLRLGAVPMDKGAVKLHLLIDHDWYLPSCAVITEGNQHEVKVAKTLAFAPGTIVVIDRGYVD